MIKKIKDILSTSEIGRYDSVGQSVCLVLSWC